MKKVDKISDLLTAVMSDIYTGTKRTEAIFRRKEKNSLHTQDVLEWKLDLVAGLLKLIEDRPDNLSQAIDDFTMEMRRRTVR